MTATLSLRRKWLRQDNRSYTDTFVEIPKSQWPQTMLDHCGAPTTAFRSKDFMVQVFEEPPFRRLSINRTDINGDGTWKEGITWDELFAIKNAVGFADCDAVEVYPRLDDVVNVSNMRHLRILEGRLPFAWRKTKPI